jgi:hypothetical protein
VEARPLSRRQADHVLAQVRSPEYSRTGKGATAQSRHVDRYAVDRTARGRCAVRNRPSSTPERLGRLYNDGEPRPKLGAQLRELQLVNDQGRAKKGGA